MFFSPQTCVSILIISISLLNFLLNSWVAFLILFSVCVSVWLAAFFESYCLSYFPAIHESPCLWSWFQGYYCVELEDKLWVSILSMRSWEWNPFLQAWWQCLCMLNHLANSLLALLNQESFMLKNDKIPRIPRMINMASSHLYMEYERVELRTRHRSMLSRA